MHLSAEEFAVRMQKQSSLKILLMGWLPVSLNWFILRFIVSFILLFFSSSMSSSSFISYSFNVSKTLRFIIFSFMLARRTFFGWFSSFINITALAAFPAYWLVSFE